MPWVGLYASGASLLCTLAMAADVFLAFRQWRLWFPCRFFTINAVSITLIAIAMKLPVDLTTEMSGYSDEETKYISLYFLVTMLANFLPSLGLMSDMELLTNIIALGILLITITVNVLIQSFTGGVYGPVIGILLFIISILFPVSVSLMVPTSRRILERWYKELHELDSTRQEINFSYKKLICHVKKYWIMAETSNPQFLIACSPVSYVFGIICLYPAIISIFVGFSGGYYGSDYKWSMFFIDKVQAKNARSGKTSKVILQWLAEKAVKVVEKFKSSKNDSLDHSEHKFIAASAMYRICQMIMNRCDEQENWPEDKDLFVLISTLNADVLCACFTNLPRVIKMKCHHDAIEKREDGIRAAAQLLGKSKKILKPHQLPNIDPNSMAYIDKWRALPGCKIPSGGASSVSGHEGSSSSNESHSITIM